MKQEEKSQEIGEQIISKLKELNEILDGLIQRCRNEEKS